MIPKKHKVWVRWIYKDDEYITTTMGNDRSKYFMFKKEGNKHILLGTSSSPLKLEQKVKDGKY